MMLDQLPHVLGLRIVDGDDEARRVLLVARHARDHAPRVAPPTPRGRRGGSTSEALGLSTLVARTRSVRLFLRAGRTRRRGQRDGERSKDR